MLKRGISAVYTSHDLSTVDLSCLVWINHESLLQPSGVDVEVINVGTTIEALVEVVGSPLSGSIFSVDSVTYTVKRIEFNDSTWVRMWVTNGN